MVGDSKTDGLLILQTLLAKKVGLVFGSGGQKITIVSFPFFFYKKSQMPKHSRKNLRPGRRLRVGWEYRIE